LRFFLRIKKKIRPAMTPIPRMTPIATPALAPPDIPDETLVAVGDEEAAESVEVALGVAARRFTSWLLSAVVEEAEVTNEDGLWVVSDWVVVAAVDSVVVVVSALVVELDFSLVVAAVAFVVSAVVFVTPTAGPTPTLLVLVVLVEVERAVGLPFAPRTSVT
jgi:hypothetical protein